MRLPLDIANAIRDVIWYKKSVVAFFQDCGVPPMLLKKVEEEYKAKTPTVKVVHKLLDDLDIRGARLVPTISFNGIERFPKNLQPVISP